VRLPRVLTSPALAVGLAVGLAAFAAGCDDSGGATPDDPGPTTSAVALPEDLCEPVLGAVPTQWQLAEEDHVTEDPSATCSLTGPGVTTLQVTLTRVPDSAAAAAALDLVCRATVRSPVDGAGRRCQTPSSPSPSSPSPSDGPPSGSGAGQPFTASVAASFAGTPSVVVVQLATTDETVALTAPAALAAVESALQPG
jgi:hypothetical protein